ncbi:MAG: nucleotide-binding protein [Calditrichia bacterium]|nr:nucleotide-binding protein [Calditrichia bacterium]
MDYEQKLARLEHLKDLVERYTSVMYGGLEEKTQLHHEICETYGEVADVFDEIIGKQRIEVPVRGGKSNYPNYFEAGFLSGRTIHTHQGKTELLKVIGSVKTLLSVTKKAPVAAAVTGHRVFLVHGHNEAALQSCARFIEKLELPLTVLREEPNRGRTIIEKFLDYSDAGFAVVLLTADDRGGRLDQPYEEQSQRARQNVIFELGFFIGKIGRDRVCALYENGVEVPSDYQGVVFIPLDPLAWRLELAKEMKAAGLPVDLNKAM